MAEITPYAWRGNIRALQGCVERAIIVTWQNLVG
ncbi:hypothetical protein [Ferrovibrio xuzhouensis]